MTAFVYVDVTWYRIRTQAKTKSGSYRQAVKYVRGYLDLPTCSR